MSQMILNCFVLGNTFGFQVVLGENITVKKDTVPFGDFGVGLLKDYICEKRNDIISSPNIVLWKVEIEETNENAENIEYVRKKTVQQGIQNTPRSRIRPFNKRCKHIDEHDDAKKDYPLFKIFSDFFRSAGVGVGAACKQNSQ